ncbi:MAG TPA: hypothetical protein VF137_07240 [Candidatus Dormibacteraeota bacterium]
MPLRGWRQGSLSLAVVLLSIAGISRAFADVPQPVSTILPSRALEPVILTGSQIPDWSTGPEVTFRAPQPPTDYGVADIQGQLPPQLRSDCYQPSPAPDVNGNVDPFHNDHNCYQSNQLPIRTVPGRTGVDPNSIRGYRWNPRKGRFEQIPFQVDTKWIHYISNNASGFAFYSGVDQELTYTYDREGFRYTTNAPYSAANPGIVCWAKPAGGIVAAPDPNPTLIDTDEMVFMARDAGTQAPTGASLPKGIVDAREVQVTDPLTGQATFVYLMLSGKDRDGGYKVQPAYTAANSPYVHYQRDPNADLFVYSQSSFGNYGKAPSGPVCTPDGKPVIGQGFKLNSAGVPVLDPSTYVQRRPLDTATVTTPRYRFRYDGRWVMDSIQVSPDDRGLSTGDYGPNLIDRWKARAFQQSPGGDTPCCGYEEEQTNWGGSSQLMGEKVGPVRIIRTTWGADSSTNNVRTEVFYPYEVRYQDDLRVHVIPPLDGIYVQRDMAAGRVTKYLNPYIPNGVPVDGCNDEVFGNFNAHLGSDGITERSDDQLGGAVCGQNHNQGTTTTIGNPTNSCSNCIHGDFDAPDYTFSGPPGTLQWELSSGPWGSLVERWNVSQVTPVGTPAAAIATQPYYRDDSCFDDGTGNDPGPKLHLRSKDEPTTWGYDPVTGVAMSPAPAGSVVHQRVCWSPADGLPNPNFSPQGDIRYFQGDIGTHGLHVEFIVDSDNAQMTVPIDEIDTEQRQVILPGDQGNYATGELYGHSFDKPLVALETLSRFSAG